MDAVSVLSEWKNEDRQASTMWTCENCDYELSADEFEDDYVFWFCDECGAYLNNQDGFDRNAPRHICQNCGYENDTTLDNIKGICSDCGKVIPDPDATLCEDCRQARKDKAKENLKTIGKMAGVVAAAVGVAYFASKTTQDPEEESESEVSSKEENSMAKYKIIFDGEEQDEVFDSEEAAEEYALYLRSCSRTGAEILHMSNPGDYDYDEDPFDEPDYEIIEE